MAEPRRAVSSKSAVTCRGVGKVWAAETERAHEALREIDLDIDGGEFVVLLGPSGCGKSTLLYLLGGFLPVESGSITVSEKPVAARSERNSPSVRS